MAYIEDGGPAGRAGIFYRAAFYVEEVQFTVQNLHERLPPHWPFIGIRSALGDIGAYPTGLNKWLAWLVSVFWKADTWAKPLVDDIADRLKKGDLDGLINDYAPGVADFFGDPWKEIKAILKKERPKGYALFDDPGGEIDNWLKDNQPKLWSFKEDSKQYVLDRLKEQSIELYNFALDPLGWIETQIGDLQADVTKFLDDPSGFVYDHLVKLDSPLAPFWADPGEWVIDHILDWIVEAILRDWRTA